MSRTATDLGVGFTRDERARASFASGLRRHVMDTLADALRRDYQTHVAPRLAEPTPEGVHRAMRERDVFRFYSSLRVTSQDLLYHVVRPPVERAREDLIEQAEALARSNVGGSLRLIDDFEVPRSVSAVDVHLMPGSYTAEYGQDDLTMGAIYEQRLAISTFGLFGPQLDDIGQSFARFVKRRFPQFDPRRILDLGCTTGLNTAAWKSVFPQAEVQGIDVSAPCLRFAAARTRSRGQSVHFVQMNAERLDLPEASVDVVFSSMFLHEVPRAGLSRVFAEAHRVLRPGGLMLHMELPPASALSPYDSFYLDWDGHYNNEPFYRAFRALDPAQLVAEAGFGRSAFFDTVVPSWSALGEAAWQDALTDGAPSSVSSRTGRLATGVQWYGFGAWKRS